MLVLGVDTVNSKRTVQSRNEYLGYFTHKALCFEVVAKQNKIPSTENSQNLRKTLVRSAAPVRE